MLSTGFHRHDELQLKRKGLKLGTCFCACVKQVTGVPGVTLWSTGDSTGMCPWCCYYFSNTQDRAAGTAYGHSQCHGFGPGLILLP